MRLLESRLEALASAAERTPHRPSIDDHVLRAAAATRNAVDLELLSPDEAGAIWTLVAERHPDVPWCARGPGLAA